MPGLPKAAEDEIYGVRPVYWPDQLAKFDQQIAAWL